uniref:Uncharacterized protein n=1 Tax=Siphoviridae sp. ctn8e14 TaxID=2827936 RepID=A0A8S5T4Z2_9CAUD|nr:MAG TPA: hypothetical protein [Siphoviridae sp. ctn8e14]
MEKIKSMVWEMVFKNDKTQEYTQVSVDTTDVYQAINTALQLISDRPHTKCVDFRLSVNNGRVDIDTTFKLGAIAPVEIIGATPGPKLRFRACRVSEVINQVLINDIRTVKYIGIQDAGMNSIVHNVQDTFRYVPFGWNIQYSLPVGRHGTFYSLSSTLDKAMEHFLSMNPHATRAALDKLTVSFGGHEFSVDDLCAWYLPSGSYNASVYCDETFSSIEQAMREGSGEGPIGICHFTLESVIQHIFRQYPVETLFDLVGSVEKPSKPSKPSKPVDELSAEFKELGTAFKELRKEYTQSLKKMNKALNKLGSITAELLNK